MNEKIRELLDKAEVYYNDDMYSDYNDLASLQKFAELIVKECCQTLHPMLRDQISRGQGVDLIKKHFGDEE